VGEKTMNLIYANRVVADNTIVLAGRLIVAERKLTANANEEKAICEKKAAGYLKQNQFLVEENAYLKVDKNELANKVARLRPWATMMKIEVYGTIAVIAILGANEVVPFIPGVNIF